jgi:hypothetical protein
VSEPCFFPDQSRDIVFNKVLSWKTGFSPHRCYHSQLVTHRHNDPILEMFCLCDRPSAAADNSDNFGFEIQSKYSKNGFETVETSILSTQCNLSDGFKSNTETNLKTSYLKNMDLKQ